MSRNLREFYDWVAYHGGLFGTLVLVLVSLLIGYALVMFVLNSFRALFRILGLAAAAEGKSVSVVIAIIWCGVSVALLAWYVTFAVREFPEWLGL